MPSSLLCSKAILLFRSELSLLSFHSLGAKREIEDRRIPSTSYNVRNFHTRNYRKLLEVMNISLEFIVRHVISNYKLDV